MTAGDGGSAVARRRRRFVFAVLVVGGLVLGRLILMWSGPAPPVGLIDGRLHPCPASPNCVCSHEGDAAHAIAPLRYSGSAPAAWQRLRNLIAGLPRTRVAADDERYLRVEFTSALVRFVDDVEFVQAAADGVIHVRSASRVGHSDLGVNRSRVEGIRAKFEADLQSAPASDQATGPASPPLESP